LLRSPSEGRQVQSVRGSFRRLDCDARKTDARI
jgi:hypothetical protein